MLSRAFCDVHCLLIFFCWFSHCDVCNSIGGFFKFHLFARVALLSVVLNFVLIDRLHVSVHNAK